MGREIHSAECGRRCHHRFLVYFTIRRDTHDGPAFAHIREAAARHADQHTLSVRRKHESEWRGIKRQKRSALSVRRDLINRVVKSGQRIELIRKWTAWRTEPRVDSSAADAFIGCPGARHRAKHARSVLLGGVNPLDDMVGEGPLDLHFGLRQGENLSAKSSETLRRDVKTGHRQQLPETSQNCNLAARIQGQQTTAFIVFLSSVIIEPHGPSLRAHKQRIVELSGRKQEFRGKAGFGLNLGRRQKFFYQSLGFGFLG